MKKISEKEKLIEEIYTWVSKDAAIPFEKERLLRIMIEATLDYLYLKKLIFVKAIHGKEN